MNHNPSGIPIAKDPITMNIVIKIEKSEFGFNGHLIISPKFLCISNYLCIYLQHSSDSLHPKNKYWPPPTLLQQSARLVI